MKKLSVALTVILAVTIFQAMVCGAEVGVQSEMGEPDGAYGAISPKYRISDSPYLKVSKDKLSWPPILPSEPTDFAVATDDPTAVEIYDISSQETTRIPSYYYTQRTADGELAKSAPFEGLLPPGFVAESVIGTDGRVQVANTATYPWRTIVKLFITFPSASGGCSGSIIGRADNNAFHVLTAGHCVYSHDHGGWATSIEVVPGLDDDYMPYNNAWATNMRSYAGWTSSAMTEHDWAVITLDRRVGNHTGWMGRMTDSSSSSIYTGVLNSAGYPQDKGSVTMWFDSDNGHSADEYNHWYYIDTYNGQSGMPIWRYVDPDRHILSVHTCGTGGCGIDSKGVNHGTRLNSDKFDRIITWIDSDTPPTDYADLIDDGQTYSGFSPNSVIPGLTTFDVWNDVRNIGTASSGGFNVSYYASTNTIISAGDHLIGTAYVSSITPFNWRDSDWDGTFPNDIPPGTYWVGWIIDSDDNVVEFSESNNTAYKSSYQLTVSEAPKPDLHVVSFTSPSQVNPGESVGHLLDLIAGNQGSGDAGGFNVGIYISNDPQITTADRLLIGGREYVNSLMAGQTYNVPLYSGMSIPADILPGNYYIGALLDEFNDVDETNENNNYLSNSIAIGGQEPSVEIKANNQDGIVYLTTSQPCNLTIALDPYDYNGDMADWFGLIQSSFAPGSWLPLFYFQTPLFDLPQTSLFDIPLPQGWYVFLFNVDDTPDGSFQARWYDYVVVIVTSAQEDQAEELPDFESLVNEKLMELNLK
jgi:V8-like Glu-specific endopeptidase